MQDRKIPTEKTRIDSRNKHSGFACLGRGWAGRNTYREPGEALSLSPTFLVTPTVLAMARWWYIRFGDIVVDV